MQMKQLFKLSLATLALSASVQTFAKDGKISVAVIAGPELNVAEEAVRVAKEKFNLEVELVSMMDYVTPNAALANKLVDANAFQHRLFLEKQIKDRGYNELTVVGNTFVYPIGAYSKKIKTLDELKDGATVVIPNDPTNLGRSLLLLQAQDLITLKDPKALDQTELDIVENPKNLRIQTADANLIARQLNGFDVGIINSTFASQNNLYPTRDALFVEDKDSPYVNLIVARQDNAEDEDIKHFVEAFNSEAVYQKAVEEFQGGVAKGW